MHGRLTATHAERRHPAFKCGDAPLQNVGRWVGNAAVAIALHLEIEQGGAMLGTVEGI